MKVLETNLRSSSSSSTGSVWGNNNNDNSNNHNTINRNGASGVVIAPAPWEQFSMPQRSSSNTNNINNNNNNPANSGRGDIEEDGQQRTARAFNSYSFDGSIASNHSGHSEYSGQVHGVASVDGGIGINILSTPNNAPLRRSHLLSQSYPLSSHRPTADIAAPTSNGGKSYNSNNYNNSSTPFVPTVEYGRVSSVAATAVTSTDVGTPNAFFPNPATRGSGMATGGGSEYSDVLVPVYHNTYN